MAENPENPQEETPDGEGLPRKAGMILPILLAILASGVGGAVGMTVMGPSVGSWMAARTSEDGGKKKSGGHGGGHGGASAASLHILDNLVVNPADSDGLRYLLVSVAVEPEDPRMVEDLASMDVALRHGLISFFGSKTVEELTDIGARDGLVADLKSVLAHEVGEELVHRIYLPQYVIQ
jgi:flagellar FliL protein